METSIRVPAVNATFRVESPCHRPLFLCRQTIAFNCQILARFDGSNIHARDKDTSRLRPFIFFVIRNLAVADSSLYPALLFHISLVKRLG